MNALHNHPVPPIYTATAPCPTCDGVGGESITVRVAGEYIDADQRVIDCDACGGSGVIPAICHWCERQVPCDRESCADCDGYVPLSFVERLSPTAVML